MNKKLKPRDKITQKMSRDGLIEVNETAGTAELVSEMCIRDRSAHRDIFHRSLYGAALL